MKRYFKHLAAICMVATLLFGCKKNNNDDQPAIENILNKNAFIVDTLAISGISTSSVTVDTLIAKRKPLVGDILLAAPTNANPYGLMIKVKSAIANGTKVVCQTEQSNLNDAFEQLYIDKHFVESSKNTAYVRTSSGNGLDANLNLVFAIPNNIASSISLSGEVHLNITGDVKYKKLKGSLLPEYALIRADLSTDGSSLSFVNPRRESLTINAKEIYNKALKDIVITVPVGPFPLPVVFAQNVIVETLPLTINSNATMNFTPVLKATLGAEYNNSTGWKNISSYSSESGSILPSKNDFTSFVSTQVELTALNFKYEVRPYNIQKLKGYYEIPNKLTLTVDSKVSPNLTLVYSVALTGGVKQEFWTASSSEISATIPLYKKTILTGDLWSTPQKPKIGDSAYGGIIVYVDNTGDHGLVAPFSDQTPTSGGSGGSGSGITWNQNAGTYFNYTPTTTNAAGTGIGTGKDNTNKIINALGNSNNNAASLCRNYNGGGYSDWYLPSKDELNLMYTTKAAIGGFFNDDYWSSSESIQNSKSYPYLQSFQSGTSSNSYQYTSGRVRAIRAF